MSAWERCKAGPAAPKPMAPGNGVTFLWRHAVDRRFRCSRRQHSEVVSSSHPRIPLSATPVPAFCSCPRYSGGLSRVRPPSNNREVGTLSDSALEPSPRRPAPSLLRPIRLSSRFEDLGLVSFPHAPHLCENTNEAFDLPIIREPEEVFRAFGLYGFGFGRDDPPPTEPSTYAVGSVAGGAWS